MSKNKNRQNRRPSRLLPYSNPLSLRKRGQSLKLKPRLDPVLPLAETLETSGDVDSDHALINKANPGSVLTQSELSRLKEADPALYSRVVKAEQAREELILFLFKLKEKVSKRKLTFIP